MSTVHADDQPTLSAPPVDQDTTELTTSIATATDRCPNCGARMAPDQRYCINCGERRTGGGLRDALPKTSVAAPPPRKRRGLTSSSSTNLIAGVATLLLALGVGVLIGRTGHTSAKSTTPQVVTVQGAGAAAGTNTTASSAATAAGAAATAKHASTKHKAHKTAAKHATAVQKTAAKNGVKLPPPVVKVGQKCTKGAKGCQGGKFTGNFFGGG